MFNGNPSLESQMRQFLTYIKVEKNLSINTVFSYTYDLEKYVTHLSELHIYYLDDVTEKHIRDYISEMKNSRAPKKGVSPKSTTRSIASIRQFHKFCVNEGFSKNNPAENIESLKLPIRLPKALTIYEMFKLLEVAGTGDSPTALRDSALLEFMYATGARASEAANLSIDDLNVNDESVRILGKGSKERIIPVGKIALERMDAYMVRSRPALIEISNRDTPLSQSDFSKVFLNKRGSVLTRTTLWWIIKDVAKRAGIDREVTPHSIRHSFATHILQGGADIRVVQELLGHSNVSTTQIYTLVTQETLRENYALYHPRA